jgi:FlaA1/EpsC-like NDP-sugar epimerase
MGATKRMAEISIQALNQSQNDTNLCMVRFGNVINSSGSVIPLFLDQISRGGPITITHKQVERYFMTIPEASSLVIQAGEMSVGGEVFVLDMGEQIKIFDLAKKLIHLSGRNIANNSNISGIEIVEVGLRPGEKMYEELLISGESQKTPNDKIFKSNEMFIVLKEFTEVVEDVKCFVKDNEVKKLKNIMSKYVDGFVA